VQNVPIMSDESPGLPDVRLDVWLDVACLFKTRSDAQKACHGGKVEVNGHPGKAHRFVRVGDQLRITRTHGRKQLIAVRALLDRHVPKAEARALYEDRTPPPTPEELEQRELTRAFRQSFGSRPPKAPDKRERRALRKLKGM
jgi:ribosome-associated heat shock protein Hsp15